MKEVCESCGHMYDTKKHEKCPLCNHVEGNKKDKPFHTNGPKINDGDGQD